MHTACFRGTMGTGRRPCLPAVYAGALAQGLLVIDACGSINIIEVVWQQAEAFVVLINFWRISGIPVQLRGNLSPRVLQVDTAHAPPYWLHAEWVVRKWQPNIHLQQVVVDVFVVLLVLRDEISER